MGREPSGGNCSKCMTDGIKDTHAAKQIQNKNGGGKGYIYKPEHLCGIHYTGLQSIHASARHLSYKKLHIASAYMRQHSKGKGEILLPDGAMEAQVVRISDLVAYLSHDVDDALRAGVIQREEIPTEVRSVLGETHGQRIDTMSSRALAGWRATHVGLVFQFYNLLPVISAEKNVELPLLLTSLSRAERKKHVAAALDIVGLTHRAKHSPQTLSGGEQQRVGIARAIVTDPTLILADEPTGDLDRKSGDSILDLMQALNEEHGKTIVMVTHDPHAASRSNRVLYLLDGQLSTEMAA